MVGELKQEGRKWPYLTSAGNTHVGQLKFFTTLYVSAHDHKRAVNTGLELTDTFQQVGKSESMESTHTQKNEDQLYTPVCI